MKKTKKWIHTRQTWKHKGRKDMVVEGMCEKHGINSWRHLEMTLQMCINGWELKDEKTWETKQVYYLPAITGK